MVDLLIPGKTPGIKEFLVDLYGKPELLFFGPDGMCMLWPGFGSLDAFVTEGTADMMDWAACELLSYSSLR